MGAVLFDLPKKGTSKLFVQASVVVRLLLTPEVSPVLNSAVVVKYESTACIYCNIGLWLAL